MLRPACRPMTSAWSDHVGRAASGQPEAVRVPALRALANLAVNAANMQPMWQDAAARGVRSNLYLVTSRVAAPFAR